jgi:antitoxin component of RelBE/YafQ-DinJ toxin-antitoxin module
MATMGLSVTGAVRVFSTQVVVDQSLPYELHMPNAQTRAAMAEVDQIAATRSVCFNNAKDMHRLKVTLPLLSLDPRVHRGFQFLIPYGCALSGEAHAVLSRCAETRMRIWELQKNWVSWGIWMSTTLA